MNLDIVDVKKPCHVSWSGMAGEGRVRECGKCEKSVYDLSSMTREEAEALIAKSEGRVCIRFYRRADGTVVTSDCSAASWRSRAGRAMAAMVFLAGGLFGFVRLHAATLDASDGKEKSPGQTISRWVNSSWNATPTPYPMKGEMVMVTPRATPTPAAKKPPAKTPVPAKTPADAPKGAGSK